MINIRLNNQIKETTSVLCKVDGQIKEVTQAFVKVDGAWNEVVILDVEWLRETSRTIFTVARRRYSSVDENLIYNADFASDLRSSGSLRSGKVSQVGRVVFGPRAIVDWGYDFGADRLGVVNDDLTVSTLDANHQLTDTGNYEYATGQTDNKSIMAGGRAGHFYKSGAILRDNDLVVTALQPLLQGEVTTPSGAEINGYMIIAGGSTDNTQSGAKDIVTVYNEDGVRLSAAPMASAKFRHSGGRIARHAVFSTGGVDTPSTVDFYDRNLVRTTPDPQDFISDRVDATAGNINENIFFAGGLFDGVISDKVEGYDNGRNKIELADLTVGRWRAHMDYAGEYGLIIGGLTSLDESSTAQIVDVYNFNLVKEANITITGPISAVVSCGSIRK